MKITDLITAYKGLMKLISLFHVNHKNS